MPVSATHIPTEFIDRLQPFGPRFIKVMRPEAGNSRSGKAPVDPGWQFAPMEADEPDLAEWLESGGNYGIICGLGIIVIDFDVLGLNEQFPATFRVRSGSGKIHLYYRSDVTENATIYKDGEHVADLQADRKQVIGPGSKHHSGGVYEVENDVALTWITGEQIERLANDRGFDIRWSAASKRAHEAAAEEEVSMFGEELPLGDFIDMSGMSKIGPDEYQGAHPIHGSDTGQNFNVNTRMNSWHCFRCDSGGGPLSWIAVQEGFIRCDESRPGAVRGKLFRQVCRYLENNGYELPEALKPKNIPASARKYFDGKTFIPEIMVEELLDEFHIVTIPGPIYYVYDESVGIYKPNGEVAIRKLAIERLGWSARRSRIEDVLYLIMAKTMNMEPIAPDPTIVAVENGILNVVTHQLSPFTPDHFITTRLPVRYDLKAKTAAVAEFFGEVLRKADIEIVQEFIGSCLYRRNLWKRALLCVGGGDNGKSVALDFVGHMLGSDNVSNVPLQDLANDRFKIALIEDKFANIAPELSSEAINDVDTFKNITGNDPIYSERKFKEPHAFYPYAKLVFACNEIPPLKKTATSAFYTRWIIIVFPYVFSNDPELMAEGAKAADLTIKDKLFTPEMLSGLLNWSLTGLKRLLKRGHFEESQGTRSKQATYTKMADPATFWIEEYLTKDFEVFAAKTEVYEAFSKWCFGENIPVPSATKFSDVMKGLHWREKRQRIDGQNVRVWAGCKIGVSQGGTSIG